MKITLEDDELYTEKTDLSECVLATGWIAAYCLQGENGEVSATLIFAYSYGGDMSNPSSITGINEASKVR